MGRASVDERRELVLREAANLLRNAQLEWASALTFGRLAEATGIDQAQIARDFGSKDRLKADLAAFVVQRTVEPDYAGLAEEWFLNRPPTMPTPTLAAVIAAWAEANDDANELSGLPETMRSEWAMWASSAPSSPEHEALVAHWRQELGTHVGIVEALIDSAVEGGAVRRSDLTASDGMMAMNCFIIGQCYLASLVPELVAADLSVRVAQVLTTALVGPTRDGPIAELERISLVPSDEVGES